MNASINEIIKTATRIKHFGSIFYHMLHLNKQLIGKSWIVFILAIILSIESVIVEFLTEIPGISSLLVAGISIPIAGAILLDS